MKVCLDPKLQYLRPRWVTEVEAVDGERSLAVTREEKIQLIEKVENSEMGLSVDTPLGSFLALVRA